MEAKASAGKRLIDKVAIVTGGGGSNSIGRAISLRLAEEGAKVAIFDIDLDGAKRVVAEIEAAGGIALAVKCDITDLDECHKSVKMVAEAWTSRIEILVNNAAHFGTMGEWRPFDEWDVDEWDKMQAVNVRGMWFCARAVFPYMKAQNYGKMINLSSSTFFEGVPGFIHYTSSKGGVIGFTRSLARELGKFGIRVNALAPGFTLSDAQMRLTGAKEQAWFDVNKSKQSLPERNELPEDLAGPAFFLASPDSDFMTGQALLVDGGLSMH
jgi:3-oxoacyl-[acyl-carrier protein] reductase